MVSSVAPKVKPTVSLPAMLAWYTMYPVATNEVVVDTATENVAADEDVLHTLIVDTTVAVEAGTVYSVSAVPIVPVDAIAPKRL